MAKHFRETSLFKQSLGIDPKVIKTVFCGNSIPFLRLDSKRFEFTTRAYNNQNANISKTKCRFKIEKLVEIYVTKIEGISKLNIFDK